MNNFFRALIAGAAAKKFGGGCLGTILVFVIVWVALGQCGSTPRIRENPQSINKKLEINTSFIHSEFYRPTTRIDLVPMPGQTAESRL